MLAINNIMGSSSVSAKTVLIKQSFQKICLLGFWVKFTTKGKDLSITFSP